VSIAEPASSAAAPTRVAVTSDGGRAGERTLHLLYVRVGGTLYDIRLAHSTETFKEVLALLISRGAQLPQNIKHFYDTPRGVDATKIYELKSPVTQAVVTAHGKADSPLYPDVDRYALLIQEKKRLDRELKEQIKRKAAEERKKQQEAARRAESEATRQKREERAERKRKEREETRDQKRNEREAKMQEKRATEKREREKTAAQTRAQKLAEQERKRMEREEEKKLTEAERKQKEEARKKEREEKERLRKEEKERKEKEKKEAEAQKAEAEAAVRANAQKVSALNAENERLRNQLAQAMARRVPGPLPIGPLPPIPPPAPPGPAVSVPLVPFVPMDVDTGGGKKDKQKRGRGDEGGEEKKSGKAAAPTPTITLQGSAPAPIVALRGDAPEEKAQPSPPSPPITCRVRTGSSVATVEVPSSAAKTYAALLALIKERFPSVGFVYDSEHSAERLNMDDAITDERARNSENMPIFFSDTENVVDAVVIRDMTCWVETETGFIKGTVPVTVTKVSEILSFVRTQALPNYMGTLYAFKGSDMNERYDVRYTLTPEEVNLHRNGNPPIVITYKLPSGEEEQTVPSSKRRTRGPQVMNLDGPHQGAGAGNPPMIEQPGGGSSKPKRNAEEQTESGKKSRVPQLDGLQRAEPRVEPVAAGPGAAPGGPSQLQIAPPRTGSDVVDPPVNPEQPKDRSGGASSLAEGPGAANGGQDVQQSFREAVSELKEKLGDVKEGDIERFLVDATAKRISPENAAKWMLYEKGVDPFLDFGDAMDMILRDGYARKQAEVERQREANERESEKTIENDRRRAEEYLLHSKFGGGAGGTEAKDGDGRDAPGLIRSILGKIGGTGKPEYDAFMRQCDGKEIVALRRLRVELVKKDLEAIVRGLDLDSVKADHRQGLQRRMAAVCGALPKVRFLPAVTSSPGRDRCQRSN
jgi:actin-related protein